jgi:hypothetical protein
MCQERFSGYEIKGDKSAYPRARRVRISGERAFSIAIKIIGVVNVLENQENNAGYVTPSSLP